LGKNSVLLIYENQVVHYLPILFCSTERTCSRVVASLHTVPQSHILIAGISTRVGKHQQHASTCFVVSDFLFCKKEDQEFSSMVECACSWGFPPSLNRERLSFSGLAFARVTILNVWRSNGVSCPA
jgi:hypothetical protein